MPQLLDDFLARNGFSEAAKAVVAAEQKEIELFKRYGDRFGYGMHLAERRQARGCG
jgi:hypothetical protein